MSKPDNDTGNLLAILTFIALLGIGLFSCMYWTGPPDEYAEVPRNDNPAVKKKVPNPLHGLYHTTYPIAKWISIITAGVVAIAALLAVLFGVGYVTWGIREYRKRSEPQRLAKRAAEDAQQKTVQEQITKQKIRDALWSYYKDNVAVLAATHSDKMMEIFIRNEMRDAMNIAQVQEVFDKFVLETEKKKLSMPKPKPVVPEVKIVKPIKSGPTPAEIETQRQKQMQSDIEATIQAGKQSGKTKAEINAEIEYIRQHYGQ